MADFDEVKNFESNFILSSDGWDEHGVGALYFYDVKLRPEYEYLIPEGTVSIGLFMSSEDGVVQFEFYSSTETNDFTYRTFKVAMVLGEEKFYDDQV